MFFACNWAERWRLENTLNQGRILWGGLSKRAEVYRALSAQSYSDTAHISIIVNHCFMSCKHKALKSAVPKRQFCGCASNTKADSEEKGLRETTIRWITWVNLYTPVAINFAWLWWSPTASEAVSYRRHVGRGGGSHWRFQARASPGIACVKFWSIVVIAYGNS